MQHQQTKECNNELINIPLTYYFEEAGLELQQVSVRTAVPKGLKFSHQAEFSHLAWLQMIRYSKDGQTAAIYRCNAKTGRVQSVAARGGSYSEIHIVPSLYCRQREYSSLNCDIFECGEVLDLKYEADKILVLSRRRFANCKYLNVIAISDSLDNQVRLDPAKFPANFEALNTFALADNDCIICNKTAPSLFIWNYETGTTQVVHLHFKEPTKVIFVTDGPLRSIICICKEDLAQYADTSSWYKPKPDPSTKPKPKSSLALVDVDTGTVLWQRYRKPDDISVSQNICYYEGFFYIAVSMEDQSTRFEVIDAENGTICSITLSQNYALLRLFNVKTLLFNYKIFFAITTNFKCDSFTVLFGQVKLQPSCHDPCRQNETNLNYHEGVNFAT